VLDRRHASVAVQRGPPFTMPRETTMCNRNLLQMLAAVGFGCLLCLPLPAVDLDVPRGLPAVRTPQDNAYSPEKVELGKQLYFDKRLSADNTVSCASCHDPKKGWSNNDKTAEGVGGQRGGRSAPTVMNTAYQNFQFWDGRAGTLEQQALGPIANPIEMNLPIEKAIEKIGAIKGYQEQFQKVFGAPVNADNLAKAIAAFERTVLSGDSPYDRYKAGDKQALSPKAEEGMKLFFGKANCSACHSGPNFSDNGFHNLGVAFTSPQPDLGRVAVTKVDGDKGAFKTPSLRDIAKTGPYMHDGSLATLEEVVSYYNKGGTPNDFLDEEVFPLKLNPEQVAALVAFLKEGLSSSKYPDVEPPQLPE
jgi:cytochrome c peroxidase